MGAVRVCALYEDTNKGYLPSQDAIHRQPEFTAILASKEYILRCTRMRFLLHCSQAMVKVACLLFVINEALVPLSVLSLTVIIRIAYIGQRT